MLDKLAPLALGLTLAAAAALGCSAPNDEQPDALPTLDEVVEVCEDTAICVEAMCESERSALEAHNDLEPDIFEDEAAWTEWDEANSEIVEVYASCANSCTPEYGVGDLTDSPVCTDGPWLDCAAAWGRSHAFSDQPALSECEDTFDGYPW